MARGDTPSGSGKKPSPDENPLPDWDKVRQTATRTEVVTNPEGDASELLRQAEQPDPALIVIQGDMLGRVFRLKEGKSRVGRHPSNDISIQQRAVSAVHAEIRRAGDTVIVQDMGSTNGTVVNGVAIQRPLVLQKDDQLKIGSCVFRYTDNQLDASFTENLHNKGSIDALTGAYNKAYLVHSLGASIDIARTGFPLSIIIFDLDHFKKTNDTYGHIAGDYVLKETCRVIRESGVRTEDILGRFGGEEFVLIMPDASLEVALGVAERIRKTLETHDFVHDDRRIPVTASLGVVSWIPAFKVADDMIEAADQLLYKSKQEGRNRVSWKR
jgi:two-component system cell cycle response regulator